jgi:Tfp pilus assembly protein PilX
LLLGAVPAGAQQAETARATAQKVLKNPFYQREMPQHPELKDLDDPEDLDFRGDGSGEGGGAGQVTLPVIGAGAAIGKVVFIVLIVVVVLLLVGWLGQAFLGRRREAPADEVASEGADGAAVRERERTFDEATRLAAEGRYAEAVHALLLAAIRHFAERSRVSIQPSRTSRELVRLLPLGAEAREAFSDLVRTVELSLFGGAPVGQEEYERSLARFRDLTRRAA